MDARPAPGITPICSWPQILARGPTRVATAGFGGWSSLLPGPWIAAANPAANPTANRRRAQRARFDRIVSALTEVVAGRLGRLRFKPPQAPAGDDPLTLPSRVWRSVTPFVATRNMRGGLDAPDDFVKTDVVNECARRGLPVPKGVQVLNAAVGPRGGCPTARVEIEFTTAVSGPLMLGRTSHTGGGLFHAVPPKSSTT